MSNSSDLVSRSQAAEIIGVTRQTLLNWEKLDRGPSFERVNQTAVIYSREECIEWREQHEVMPGVFSHDQEDANPAS